MLASPRGMGDTATIASPDGATVSYRVLGDGPRALVLVHGWMTSGAVFDELVAALERAGAGVTAIVPDLVGSGASSRPASGYALLRYAADVLAVIEAAGRARPVVLGHSMGGQIAQLVAAALPDAVAGLVLVSSVPLGGLRLPPGARALCESAAGDRDKLGALLDLASPALPAAARARLVELALGVSAPPASGSPSTHGRRAGSRSGSTSSTSRRSWWRPTTRSSRATSSSARSRAGSRGRGSSTSPARGTIPRSRRPTRCPPS